MNILIVKLSAIGDVIHTLPSLAALRKLYPDAHITWVVEKAAADLVVGHPLLDRSLIFERKKWIADCKKGRFSAVRSEAGAFFSQLRDRTYDLVIDFHGLLKSSIIVFLSRGKRKLGYDSWQEMSGLFLNEKIPEDMNKHAVDRYLDFPQYLGAPKAQAEFFFPETEQAETTCTALFAHHGLSEKLYIAINPIALWETKLWDNAKFASLADMIQQQLHLTVVFTGRDKETLDKITLKMATKAVNIGGQTSLLSLACIYKKAKAVVTTDSGPMHLAAALDVPVLALFGPTDPARTGPYGPGHTVIRTGIPCSPCLLKKCKTRKCMEDITPEMVFEAVKKLVENG